MRVYCEDQLVYVFHQFRHSNRETQLFGQLNGYQQGHEHITLDGIRQAYLLENLEIQVDAYSTNQPRTLDTFNSFMYGLVNSNSIENYAPQLKFKHGGQNIFNSANKKSISQNRAKLSLDISKLRDGNLQQDEIWAVEEVWKWLYLKKKGVPSQRKSQYDFFYCRYHTSKHIDISTPIPSDNYFKNVFNHFDKLGLIVKFSMLSMIGQEKFREYGFRMLYDFALYYTQLRESFGQETEQLFNKREWDQINQIITTFQFATIDKKMRYNYQGTQLKLIQDLIQNKVDCLLSEEHQAYLKSLYGYSNLPNYDQVIKGSHCMRNKSNPNYDIQAAHDINLILTANAFGLEINYKEMDFTSSFIIELYYDVESQVIGQCFGEECFYLKLKFNEIDLFSELGYCDHKTNRCGYINFKNYVSKTYYQPLEHYESVCNEQYDPNEIEMVRVWKT
ncbi:UNKNOWN [Stylonychia lemnae]|uniref:Histidine acid phosphatase family protein n=1 Tax=Stylonychia lemnae TaxID=5949 RepID=A0A078B3F4_STYLE|nr:UNKNOWN [Stylonychia lemnae]|eukprot:CDW88786.1 UNKNOWN [Stylonychia lemnae]